MLRTVHPPTLHHRLLTAAGLCLPGRRGMRTLTVKAGRLFGSTPIALHHEAGFLFQMRLDDPCYTPLLFSNYDYEPEVARMIAASNDVDIFLDCGANKGYWTACALTRFSRVIAIEASPTTYQELLRNAKGATTYNAAVYSASGCTMDLMRSEIRHGQAYLTALSPHWKDSVPDDQVESVKTITLDELIPEGARALIKLDVEGGEIEALRGAQRALHEGAKVIYEDHAKDKECTPSRFLIKMGKTITYEGETLTDVDSIRAVKRYTAKGYNFMAI